MRIAALTAALIVALSLAACGDDEAAKTAEGTGYEVTVPDGWRDETEANEDVELEGLSPDLVLLGDRDEGLPTHANVVHAPQLGVGLDAQVRAERAALEAGLIPGLPAPAPARALTPVERTTLDGEPARAHEYELSVEGDVAKVRQVFSRHDGVQYAVTLRTTTDRFEEERGRFESLLDSWRWR